MSEYKKYIIAGSADSLEEAYYKGQQTWDHNKYPESYSRLVRIVPSSLDETWNIPTGVEGKTLGTLKDHGNGIIMTLGSKEIRLDYAEYNYLQNMMRIERMNQQWPDDKIEEYSWEPSEEVTEHYEVAEE